MKRIWSGMAVPELEERKKNTRGSRTAPFGDILINWRQIRSTACAFVKGY